MPPSSQTPQSLTAGDAVQLLDGSIRQVERVWLSDSGLRVDLDNGLSPLAGSVTIVERDSAETQTTQRAAAAAVTSLVNGGYTQQIAREIVSGVRAEVRAEVERVVRAEIAADFKAYGKSHATLTWGQAYFIATDGPNGGAS
ncbi:hypothetical protein AB0M68_03880 [Streptomyces sp. NPDC051453]|uniref:hypothetical protein n=1 Tax=Streptomyces sp. NPDC051453 TaxID=3154941 RepID=UPI00343780AE